MAVYTLPIEQGSSSLLLSVFKNKRGASLSVNFVSSVSASAGDSYTFTLPIRKLTECGKYSDIARFNIKPTVAGAISFTTSPSSISAVDWVSGNLLITMHCTSVNAQPGTMTGVTLEIFFNQDQTPYTNYFVKKSGTWVPLSDYVSKIDVMDKQEYTRLSGFYTGSMSSTIAYAPFMPTNNQYNEWEDPISFGFYTSSDNGANFTTPNFTVDRTAFKPAATFENCLSAAYEYSDLANYGHRFYIMSEGSSTNTFVAYGTLQNNVSNFVGKNEIFRFTSSTDRVLVQLQAGGGGGSTGPDNSTRGAGGAGGGCASFILDLSRLRIVPNGFAYRVTLGEGGSGGAAGVNNSGNDGEDSSLNYLQHTGRSSAYSDTCIVLATGGGGASPALASQTAGWIIYPGSTPGKATFQQAVDSLLYKVPSTTIAYQSSSNYEHGAGTSGGWGGTTSNNNSGGDAGNITWNIYAGIDNDGYYSYPSLSHTSTGGTGGSSRSGAGGASYWGNGGNGVDSSNGDNASGFGAGGGGGGKGGKKGGDGGPGYVRIYTSV